MWMRKEGFGWFVLLALIGLQTLVSAQSPGLIVTPVGTTYGQNNSRGFAQQYQDADIDCSEGTYPYTGIDDTTGKPIQMSIVCSQITEGYTMQAVRFTPWKCIPTIGQACLAQNTQSYNSSRLQKPGVQSPVAPPVTFHTQTNRTGFGSIWGTLASIGQTIGCSAANTYSFGLVGAYSGACAAGYNGISVDEFAAYTEAQSRTWESQLLFNRGIQNWTLTAQVQLDLINRQQIVTRDYQESMNNAVGNITVVVKNQQNQIDQVITQTAAGINAVKKQLVDTNTNVNNAFIALSLLTQGVQSEFNRTFMVFVAQVNNLTLQTNYLSNQTEKEIRVTAARFMSVQQSIMQLSTMILSITTQSQYLPMMKENFKGNREAVEARNTGSTNYQFMVENMGNPGVPDPYHIDDPALVSFTYDAPQAVYIYTSPGNLAIAATSQLQLNCGGFWISLNQYPFQSWTQVINSLGPMNCSTDEAAQGPNFCNCWIQVRERGCAMNTTGGLPTASALAAWNQWDNPNFPPDPSMFCASGAFDLPLTGLPGGIIRNASDFTTYYTQLCIRGVNPSVTGYKVFSPYFGQRYFAPYTAQACMSNIQELMSPDPKAENFNVVYSMMNIFVAAAALSATSVAEISDKILGSLPQNTTITTQEFQVTGAGPLQSCKLQVATAFDMSKFVGLFRYQVAATTQTITVYVNGELYSKIDNAVVSNIYSNRKIPDGAYISGLPGEMWVGNIYDRAYSASVPSPSPYGNQGSPDYASIPATTAPSWPTTYNLPIWRSYNVFEFNHAAASTSYEVYYNGLICESYTPFPFRCKCDPNQRGTASDGTVCSFLDVYDVTVLTENSILVTSPFNRAKGRMRILQGQMLSIAGSACPLTDTSTSIGINFNEQTVGLRNTLAMNNRFRVHTSGVCGKTEILNVNPLETYPYKLTYCVQQPGVPVVLTFDNNPGQLEPGAPDVWVPCPGNQTVLITPSQPTIATNGTGAPFVTTENRRAVTANAVAIDAQTLQTQASLQFVALTTAVIQTLAVNNIPLATPGNPSLGAFADVYDLILRFGQNASTTLSNSLGAQFEYSDLLTNYSSINRGLLNVVENATAQARAYTAQLSLLIQQSTDNLYYLISIGASNQVLLNNSVIALDMMNTVTANILASARARGVQQQLALDGLIDFLTNIGEIPGDLIDGVTDTALALGGGVGELFSGGLSAIGNVLLLVFGGIFICVILGVLIWIIVKFAAKADCANGESILLKRIQALEAKAGISTGASRRRDQEGACCASCGCCAGGPGGPQAYNDVHLDDD